MLDITPPSLLVFSAVYMKAKYTYRGVVMDRPPPAPAKAAAKPKPSSAKSLAPRVRGIAMYLPQCSLPP